MLKKKEFNQIKKKRKKKKKKERKRFSQRKRTPRRTRRSEPSSCPSMVSTRHCCRLLRRWRPKSWSNALSWVLRDRSSRKLSKTSSLKANATSISKISATLAIAIAFCRFNPNRFASFLIFVFFFCFVLFCFFLFDFVVRVSISNGICISS